MLNFGLAPKGTTPHRNNGKLKENAAFFRCWWGKTMILRTSHIKFQYSASNWLEQCSEYVTFNSAYTFVLLLQLHCIGGTFRFAPRKKRRRRIPGCRTPPQKRRRQTSKTLRDLPQKRTTTPDKSVEKTTCIINRGYSNAQRSENTNFTY